MEEAKLRPTMELRIAIRTTGLLEDGMTVERVLQQKHEIYVVGMTGDGFDGGETWETMIPSGKFKWVDVPICNEEEE